MDLIERINVSIESLQDPEGKVFDFDKEIELLLKLKNFIINHSNEQNVIDNYKKQIEELDETISVLEGGNSELENRCEEIRNELEKFFTLMKNEISGKMKLLGYPEDEMKRVSEMNKFSEICDFREKVLREFDLKFKVKQVVKDTPKKELINYSKFKI